MIKLIGGRIEEIRKTKLYRYVRYLIILSPCMSAFRAPEEPHLAFIGSPQLAEPPESKIVLAFRAFYLDGGHGFDFRVFIINNSDLIFRAHLTGLHLVGDYNITNIPAFPALKLTPGRDHHRLTLRTEHRNSIREQRRLTLLSGTLHFTGCFYGVENSRLHKNHIFFVLRQQKSVLPSESFFC